MRQYRLDAHGEPRPCNNINEWAEWYETADNQRVVKQEIVCGYKVSTVFLGLDHNWKSHGPPVLWETMVFRSTPEPTAFSDWTQDDTNWSMDRCSGTREQAMAMHERMVAKVTETYTTPENPDTAEPGSGSPEYKGPADDR